MAIGNDNLWSGTYSTLKTFLEANLVDPRRRFKSNWVHPGPVNISAKGFDGFPFVILRVDYSDSNPSINLNTTTKEATIVFEVVSDSATEVDTWSDEIYNDIKTEGKLDEIKGKMVQSSPIDRFVDENGKKVYSRVITMTGRFRK